MTVVPRRDEAGGAWLVMRGTPRITSQSPFALTYHRAVDPVERIRVHAREGDTTVERTDSLAVEEPLEIRVRGSLTSPAVTFVTTMRTPGHDEELSAGLLFAEGVLEQRDDLLALDHPTDPRVDPDLRANVIIATLSPRR